MVLRLRGDVAPRARKLANTHRAQVISIRPSQASPRRQPVAIREPRARAFETLHQPRDVDHRWQLHNRMNVIRYDPQLQNAGAMPRCFLP